MQISPLFELLIFIEDKKIVDYSDMDFFPAPVLRGILGKMEAMKLIERTPESKFKISKKGQQTLNNILDNLHKSTLHWDGKWRFISFSVAESNRSLRDKFRRYLDSNGIKMIMTGLWITPLDIKDEVINEAKGIGIVNNLLIVESDTVLPNISKETLIRLWDFDSSKQDIYDFIASAEEFLKSKNHDPFEVKKMIFKYALTLENQPKLPIELFPADWPQFRANLTYKKIRRVLS